MRFGANPGLAPLRSTTVQKAVEIIAVLLLVTVVTLRPLILEKYDTATDPVTVALAELSDATPVRTLVFDVLIMLGAFGWLVSRAIGPARRYRFTGLEAGMFIVLLAAVASCWVAGNKRIAINATIDWLCYPVLAIALAQLLTGPVLRRLFIAAILASACAQAVECYGQYLVTNEDTRQQYEKMKVEFWASQQVPLDSPKVALFERRVLANEATGFLAHGNVTASYLVLTGFMAAGVARGVWRGRRKRSRAGAVLCGLLAAFLLGAVPLTGSIGALSAAAIGAAFWLLTARARVWIGRNRGKALIAGWGLTAFVLAAVIAHGIYHGSLPHASLDFRWKYWEASAGIVQDAPWTGVGRENFGRHYLRHKPITSPEEVANPHNLFVQAAADWGVPGLVGVVVMLVGVSMALVPSVRRRAGFEDARGGGACELVEPAAQPRDERRSGTLDQRRSTSAHQGDTLRTVIVLGAFVGIAAMAVRPSLLGIEDPLALDYLTVIVSISWVAGFGLVAWGMSQVGTLTSADDGEGETPTPAATPTDLEIATASGACAGIVAFLIHEMINYALFLPGSATTFFAIVGYCLAVRNTNVRGEGSPVERMGALRRIAPVALFPIAVIVIFVAFILPVVRASRHLERARQTAESPLVRGVSVAEQPAGAAFRRAADADPLDPTPPSDHAAWLFRVASIPQLRGDALDLAESSISEAIRRDPFNVAHRRRCVELLRAKAEHTERTDDFEATVWAAREALSLYPMDPAGLILLGDCLLAQGLATGSADVLDGAIARYREALQLDDARPSWETLRRMPTRRRAEIEAKINQAQEAMIPAKP